MKACPDAGAKHKPTAADKPKAMVKGEGMLVVYNISASIGQEQIDVQILEKMGSSVSERQEVNRNISIEKGITPKIR